MRPGARVASGFPYPEYLIEGTHRESAAKGQYFRAEL